MNYNEYISLYFKWGDALYLPSWKVYHEPTKTQMNNIEKLAHKMDDIITKYSCIIQKDVDEMEKLIRIHCWIRPSKVKTDNKKYNGKDYNKFVGGARKSAHRLGKAIDWSLRGYDCNELRPYQKGWLEEAGLRAEDHSGQWFHNDSNPVKYRRYFKI